MFGKVWMEEKKVTIVSIDVVEMYPLIEFPLVKKYFLLQEEFT